MSKTLRDRYVAALNARGETLVKETFKFRVYTRKEGGYYYVGRRGSLRFGANVSTSIPCSHGWKRMLIGA